MANAFRPSVRDAVAEFSRSLGTLVGLVWLLLVASLVVEQVADASPAEGPVPVELLWIGALAVAAAGAVWLVDDGYERLGADPAGVWAFVWLAVFLVPLAFVPLRLAAGYLAPADLPLDAAFVLATTVAAGWLSFYGGLERLALELDDFIRVLVYAVALGLVPVAVAVLADAALLTDDRVAAGVALAVQLGACWLGLTRDVP